MSTEHLKQLPDTLYHYCGVAAFKTIIESKKLWLSDALSMNDYLETRWAQTVISRVCDKYKHNIPEEIQNYFRNLIDSSLELYLFCFSSQRDLLSQWRGYADDGKGFSIGFNKNALEVPSWPLRAHTRNLSNLVIHNVNYDESDQEHRVEKVMGSRIYKPHSNNDWTGGRSPDYEGLHLKTYAGFFKNHHFSQEEEWRIVYDARSKGSEEYFDLGEMKFRQRGNDIIRYYEWDFPPPHADLITEVVKGPKNNIHDNIIEQFLHANGFTETKPESSTISYR